MTRSIIQTIGAPGAIGTYSQAVKTGNTVYLSGQIPLTPDTMEIVEGGVRAQIIQVFDNISAVVSAAGGEMSDIAKLNIYLRDMSNFPLINEIMAVYFSEPYPARAAIAVSGLPKNAEVEIDAVMVIE